MDFTPLAPCRIDAQLDVQVLNGELTCVNVFAEAQQPMACLLSSHLSLTELYLDVEATNVVHLLNQTSLPTTFRWEAPQGSDTAFAQAEVIPGQGMLAGREEMALAVKLKVSKVVSDIFLLEMFFTQRFTHTSQRALKRNRSLNSQLKGRKEMKKTQRNIRV